MKKLTHDINAYKQHNINKSDNNHVIVYKFLDKLLDELASWNNDISELIIDAKNVITIDNFKNKDSLHGLIHYCPTFVTFPVKTRSHALNWLR